MKQKAMSAGRQGFAPILILILIALAVVGYFGYKNYWPKLQNSITPTPTTTSDLTANWKIHQFTKLGISVKLPEFWFVHEESPIYGTNITTDISYPVDVSPQDVWRKETKAVVVITSSPKTETLEKQAENYTKRDTDPLNIAPSTTVDGQNAIFLEDTTHFYKVVLVDKDQTSYFISIVFSNTQSAQEVSPIFDQILSTFKFTSSIPSPTPANTQPTGTSSEGKFCGGFAANLPENQCPNGFYCKLDGKYPDAGGICTKN